MSFLCVAISLGLAMAERVTGQLTLSHPPASSCLTPVTFTGCDVLSSKISECSNLPPSATSTEYAECFCTQEVFNAISDCESESRVCARSPNNDHYFDDLRTQWLKRCRPEITFTLTTPILSTYASGTYSDPSCTSTAISACQSLQFLTSQCSSSYSGTTASAYYSCVCQQEAVSQASLCEIYGASCLGSTVISSTLFINQYCVSGVSTQTPTVVSTTTSSSQQPGTSTSSSSPTPGTNPITAVPTSTAKPPTSTLSASTTSNANKAACDNVNAHWPRSLAFLALVYLQHLIL